LDQTSLSEEGVTRNACAAAFSGESLRLSTRLNSMSCYSWVRHSEPEYTDARLFFINMMTLDDFDNSIIFHGHGALSSGLEKGTRGA